MTGAKKAAGLPPLEIRGVFEHVVTLRAGRDMLSWVDAGDRFPSAQYACGAYHRAVAVARRLYADYPDSWWEGRDADVRLLAVHLGALRTLMRNLIVNPGDLFRRALVLDAMEIVSDVLADEIADIGGRLGPVIPGLVYPVDAGDAE